MHDDQPRRPGPTDDSTPDGADRLDSWKEIAAFLKRDVRTVQRWEKQAGLPVHRHAEARLRTAYAYRSELEQWWRRHAAAGHDAAEPHEASEPAAAGRAAESVRRPPTAGMAAVALVVAAAACGLAWRAWRPPSAAAPAAPVRLVAAALDLDADLVPLEHVLTEAVGRALSADPHVLLLTAAERAQAFRLMRLPPDAPLTVDRASELAIRNGRGAYVVAGRIHRRSTRYAVGFDVVDSAAGKVVQTLDGTAAGADALPAFVERLVRRLARALPSPPAAVPPDGGERLAAATTASLDALRLYSHAMAAARRRQWAASELLARRAIALDERFATAYATLAWAICNQGRPLTECLAPAARARELAADASDREHYFIAGTYYTLSGDAARAVAAFEALVRLHPGDAHAIDRLIDCYWQAGRVRDAAERMAARASAAPDDFYANVRAAQAMRIVVGDPVRAEVFLRRSRALASSESLRERPLWGAWLTLLPAFEGWVDGRPQDALQTIAAAARGLDARVGRERDGFATAVGFSYLALGRVRDAERTFRSAAAPARQVNLATLALAVGDRAGARDWLQQVRDQRSVVPALFAQAGLIDDAERGLERYFGAEHGSGIAALARGLIAAHRGRPNQAAAALQEAVERLQYAGLPEYFMAVEALAQIRLRRGESDRAVALLDRAVGARERTYGSARWSAAFWIRLNAQLIAVNRRLGRRAEARTLSERLAGSLACADRAHPDSRLVALPVRPGC